MEGFKGGSGGGVWGVGCGGERGGGGGDEVGFVELRSLFIPTPFFPLVMLGVSLLRENYEYKLTCPFSKELMVIILRT